MKTWTQYSETDDMNCTAELPCGTGEHNLTDTAYQVNYS